MPKEVIYAEDLPYGEDSPARSIVEVRWNGNGGEIEMVTKCVHAADETDFVPPLEAIQMDPIVSERPLTRVEVEALAEPVMLIGEARQSGFYVHLDRRATNSLITVLRRARDKTFGRDA